ncbi:hypothetical protein NECAME_17019 [Necator americanus]|uniref:Transmembrane protein 231 n=1 Tax=Necator americanus TaxID=51031 RepID=W2TUM8_NECAM|nr:hypothetical protein NECAME_17019 [Necator americanus]ETN84761.1 hypothetical protein NECAME_17019 [Necator americanus]
MVYEVVFRQPLYRVYSASHISIAYMVKILFDAIRVLLPLVIIFSTHGLWKKTGAYRERPKVTFEEQYLVVLQSNDGWLFSSTLPVLNSADPSHFSVSQIEYQWIQGYEDDDQLLLDIWIPTSNRSFNNFVYFVFFRYHLEYHSAVEAEIVLYDSIRLPDDTQSILVLGRMAADQKQPFRWRECYQLLDPKRRDVEHYKPDEIAARITRQGFNARLDRKIQIYGDNKEEDDRRFHLKLDILISEDEFIYRTDIWELLKWAAVQYLTAFVLVHYIVNRFLTSLFESRLVEAIPCCK